MNCPTCNRNCVLPAEQVLDDIFQVYMACSSCIPDPLFNKKAPFHENFDERTGRCGKCGKRHLDHVIGNVLTILKEKDLFPDDAALSEIGTPLITFGFQIPYPPRLGNDSLVLIMDSITKEVAEIIVTDVPEVKGVVKRIGSPAQSIGILDTDRTPHTYELQAGCDMRCDIISSSLGELCIYKNQSKIHIEFNNTKTSKIEGLYLKGELENSVVVDGLCGPGTLGLLCALGGAKKVIFNDAWLPAVRNTILNIMANSEILGVSVDFEEKDNTKIIGDEPILMAEAKGRVEMKVYHGNIKKLGKVVGDSDVCLVDAFPSMDVSRFIPHCRAISKKTVVI